MKLLVAAVEAARQRLESLQIAFCDVRGRDVV